jgi:GT2 family glycosyltransferase
LLDALAGNEAWFATGKALDFTHRERVDGAGDAICRGGTAWRLGHGKVDGPIFSESRSTYFPSATATVFRRSFFDRVGLLEESFFAYLEDVDLGGVYVPRAVAFHHSGQTAGVWSGQMVEWLTCHQLLLLAKFYSPTLLLRFGWPIVTAQVLWALLAISRGRALGWTRGILRGLWRFRDLRKGSRSLRQDSGRLASVLESAEADIARVQKATSWDSYWRWYFRLARTPAGFAL